MKITGVLLLAVLVLIPLAEAGNEAGEQDIKHVGGIKPISSRDWKLFRRNFMNVTRQASRTMGDANININTIEDHTLPESKVILAEVVTQLKTTNRDVKTILRRGRMFIMRLFVSGYGDENRCEGITEKDVYKRSVTSSDYNVRDKRVMCLIRSMDDMIETFEVASTDVEEEAITAAATPDLLPGKCDSLQKRLEIEFHNEDLHEYLMLSRDDFGCLKNRINYYVDKIIALCKKVEKVSPDALRMALLKSQVIFQSLYEDTRAVLEPFLHGMHVLFAGIDYCEPNPCQNGGRCTELVAGYSCLCATGYTGTNCQTVN